MVVIPRIKASFRHLVFPSSQLEQRCSHRALNPHVCGFLNSRTKIGQPTPNRRLSGESRPSSNSPCLVTESEILDRVHPSSCEEDLVTRRITPVLATVALVATLVPAVALGAESDRAGQYDITVVSSPPEFVSGDDARLEIGVPPGQVDKVAITVDGRDVTDAFMSTDSRTLEGVIDGLVLGENLVEVRPGAEPRQVRS